MVGREFGSMIYGKASFIPVGEHIYTLFASVRTESNGFMQLGFVKLKVYKSKNAVSIIFIGELTSIFRKKSVK